LKRVWAIVLAFLLVVGVIVSVNVLASLLATIVGGTVTVVEGDGIDSLWLYVDSDDWTKTDWTRNGTNPYLDAIDYPTNFVNASGNNLEVGDFNFTDSGKSTETIINVTVQIYARHQNSKNLEVFLWNGSSYPSLGVQALPPSWEWVNYTATTVLDTWAKIDGAKIYLESLDNSPTYEVDCARLQVYYNSTS
jgi:hypothetical protein